MNIDDLARHPQITTVKEQIHGINLTSLKFSVGYARKVTYLYSIFKNKTFQFFFWRERGE